ncbi:hypothetical protein F4819DRAFT_481955 [Hypoxylon fuscum]|nr:hypothetical protein F4819DRAFT_481955 [Hypoxylon fuscum]
MVPRPTTPVMYIHASFEAEPSDNCPRGSVDTWLEKVEEATYHSEHKNSNDSSSAPPEIPSKSSLRRIKEMKIEIPAPEFTSQKKDYTPLPKSKHFLMTRGQVKGPLKTPREGQ